VQHSTCKRPPALRQEQPPSPRGRGQGLCQGQAGGRRLSSALPESRTATAEADLPALTGTAAALTRVSRRGQMALAGGAAGAPAGKGGRISYTDFPSGF